MSNDFLFDDAAPAKPEPLIIPRREVSEVPGLSEALLKMRAQEKRRRYLGASSLGEQCERRVAYAYRLGQTDFPPRVIALLRLGHLIETEVETLLRAAGWNIVTELEDGRQLSYETHGGQHRGHCDGVVLSAPNINGPCVLEVKSMNRSRYAEAMKKGISVSHPLYYDQCQMYMHHLSWNGVSLRENPAVLIAYNKDDSQIVMHRIAYDPQRVAFLLARVERVLATENPEDIARVAREPSDFRCRVCPFAARCWKNDVLIYSVSDEWS